MMKKKLFTLLAICVMAVTSAWADDQDYLCFTAQEKTDVAFKVTGTLGTTPSLQYSTDKTNWTDYTFGTTISLTNVGDKVYFKATTSNNTFSESSSYITFSSTKKVAASGNIMSLLDATCAKTAVPQYAFFKLFYGCTSLTTAPALPATTLAKQCYYCMFYGCTGLTTAPTLPATTLADYCYYSMFYGCTSLTTAPALPATKLAQGCYRAMFQGCTRLTTAPALPATTLATYCYRSMFYNCGDLTTAPALPATKLAEQCYYEMFENCTGLTTAPALPATTLATDCYSFMFAHTSLTTAPELPATTLANSCYWCMFYDCTRLNKVTVNFTNWNTSEGATHEWLYNVAAKGTFYCPASLAIPAARSTYNVPAGWTIVITLDESSTKKAVKDNTSKNVQINRTFYKDGGNNTICLPFSLDATALASSPLAGYTKLQEFSSATIVNPGQENETLELTMTDATAIEAGKPYIIAWASGDDLVNPVFEGVTIAVDEGSKSEASNGVQFCGTLTPYAMDANDKSCLFVVSGNQLNWPNVDGNLKGFRGYFTVDLGQNSPIRQGMLAMLTEGIKTTPTQLDEAAAAEKVQKLIENGHVVIISNGVRYDMNGKVIK